MPIDSEKPPGGSILTSTDRATRSPIDTAGTTASALTIGPASPNEIALVSGSPCGPDARQAAADSVIADPSPVSTTTGRSRWPSSAISLS